MDKQFLSLIKNEDVKNPHSDDELAAALSTSRQKVLKLRKKHNIPTYTERRKPFLLEEMHDILMSTPDMSDRKLTQKLEERGFHVSSFLVSSLHKDLLKKQQKKTKAQIPRENVLNQNEEVFKHIIGVKGSISSKIRQSIAAVLYPPNGLHTIIIGQTGTGKTQLADAMFNLALKMGRVSRDHFIRFNCADYANNSQLILSQLFGHVKGAFTGAECDKTGLIEKADKGILFLDEIHRLPVEGQEILFSIIDKGIYRKLGETEAEHHVNVMIIGATTEDIDSHLSLTFRRRIPMLIELPTIGCRPMDERYEMILSFFKIESERIQLKIKIKSEVICALLLYECKGNIGQFKSDIQVACARSYLKHLNQNNSFVIVEISDFNPYVYQGLSRKKYSSSKIERYIDKGVTVSPGQKQVDLFDENEVYILPNEIYKYIDERYENLKQDGTPQDLAYRIMGRELDIKLQRAMDCFEKLDIGLNKIDITKIVGQQMADTVEKILEIAEAELGRLDESLFYCLSLHLYDTVERIKQKKRIFNPELERIKEEYEEEYVTAQKMLQTAGKMLSVHFPEDEMGFVALYLRKRQVCEKNDGLVGIIVITHGHVGAEMAKVANVLVGQDLVHFISIELDEDNEIALKKTIELSKIIHNDNGILFLVDMGSSLTFGELVTKKTGIPTRTVSKAHTALVLDAAFKVLNKNTTLDELYQSLDPHNIYLGNQNWKYRNKRNQVIVTLCITGDGAALEIKKLLEDTYPEIKEKEIDVIPVGMLQTSDAVQEIIKLQEKRQVIAIVGTVNPNISGILYYPIESILNTQGLNAFRRLLQIPERAVQAEAGETKQSILDEIFNENLILTQAYFKTKDEVLDALGRLLVKHQYVKDSYLLGIYKREQISPTVFSNAIAIPHTYPSHVLKSGIAIATMKEPVKWAEGYYADKIFMFALSDNSPLVFRYLYKIGNNKELLDRLLKCTDKRLVINTLLFRHNTSASA